jgi:hypothetical protein
VRARAFVFEGFGDSVYDLCRGFVVFVLNNSAAATGCLSMGAFVYCAGIALHDQGSYNVFFLSFVSLQKA